MFWFLLIVAAIPCVIWIYHEWLMLPKKPSKAALEARRRQDDKDARAINAWVDNNDKRGIR